MANQIVQLGRRVLNANRVSCSVNVFRSPNRFGYRHISRLVKPGAFDEDALAREEHQKMKRGKLLCELRNIINEVNNNLDNLGQEERKTNTIDNEIAKLHRERREIFNELNNLNNTVDQVSSIFLTSSFVKVKGLNIFRSLTISSHKEEIHRLFTNLENDSLFLENFVSNFFSMFFFHKFWHLLSPFFWVRELMNPILVGIIRLEFFVQG